MSRHLGAVQDCTSNTDAACLGDLYQWGRPADGHQVRSPLTDNTATRTATIRPANDSFIYTANLPFDWVKNTLQDSEDVDDDGADRSAFFAKTDGTGVCPVGFRVPTEAELRADTVDALTIKVTLGATAFSSFLKLPATGNRFQRYGNLVSADRGKVWSSTASMFGNNADVHGARSLSFNDNGADVDNGNRAMGYAVRCLMD